MLMSQWAKLIKKMIFYDLNQSNVNNNKFLNDGVRYKIFIKKHTLMFYINAYIYNILISNLEYFLKQISLKGDVNYCINNKVPIFYEQLLHKSTLKLRKILKICQRSFVNPTPGL